MAREARRPWPPRERPPHPPHLPTHLPQLKSQRRKLESDRRRVELVARRHEEAARALVAAGRMDAARHALRRRNIASAGLRELETFSLQVDELLGKVEGAMMVSKTAEALRQGAALMRRVMAACPVAELDRTLETAEDAAAWIAEAGGAGTSVLDGAEEEAVGLELAALERGLLGGKAEEALAEPKAAAASASAALPDAPMHRPDAMPAVPASKPVVGEAEGPAGEKRDATLLAS